MTIAILKYPWSLISIRSISMSIYQSTKVSPYVYWLTHKITGQFYIGYREANLVPSDQDLPIYKTSSDKVDELGFENFDFQIVAEFFDGDSAYDFENRTIEVNIKNPLCLNKFFMKDGQKKFRRTGPHTEETKIKMSNSGMGKIISNKTRIKLSIANSGDNCSMELRAFRSALKKGKVVSNETRIRSS